MIAPAEAALAVVGLRTIISRKTEKIRRPTLDRIDGLEREVQRLARQLVRNELSDTFYSDLNYRAALADLSRGVEIDQVQAMADAFPPEYRDVGHALSITASQVIKKLSDMVPKSVYTTVAGPTSLLPDDVKLWSFVSILEVLDNPLMVFPLMNTGALLRSQATAVRQLYPTLSADIDSAIYDATVKAKTERRSFELSPRAEVGVKNWIRTNPSPEAAPVVADLAAKTKKNLQTSQAAAQLRKDKKTEQARAKGTSKTVQMTETASQRSNPNAP